MEAGPLNCQSDSQQPSNGAGKSRVDLQKAVQSSPPNTAAIYSKNKVTPDTSLVLENPQ